MHAGRRRERPVPTELACWRRVRWPTVLRERSWGQDAKSWPQTFRPAKDDTIASVLDGYQKAVAEANKRIGACTDLGEPAAASSRRASSPSMRWALTDMIEETGRHAGHAAILREMIDGSTGR